MNRRTAITHVATLLGGTFSAPTLLAMQRWEEGAISDNIASGFTLTENHKLIVAEVAEMIIPKTATPGAKDVGVPAFIAMMLQDCYKTPEQKNFAEGLEKLENKQFLTLNADQKTAVLKQVETDAEPYWRVMKELTMLGYFTSEQGIKSSFEYVPIPGKLEMIKMKPNQKSFAY